jgi:rod shape-determining protein MreD
MSLTQPPMNKIAWFFWVTLTVVLAMSLKIAPWSTVLEPFNPDWILLTLMYWAVAIPERIGIFYAWTTGVFTDVLTGQMVGQNALIYTLIIYACLKLHKRLRQYPLVQQGVFIFCCLLSSQLLFFFLKNLQHLQHPLHLSSDFWLPILTGTSFWPLIYTVLQTVRISKQI